MIATLTGNNSFALRAELDRLVSDFIKKNSDMGLEKIDGEEADYNRIREAIESLPFLASEKLVVLRTPSANKEFVERAETLLSDVPENTDVIIYEPKLDRRSSYYKFLQKKTDYKQFNELDEYGLSTWLIHQAKNRGGSLTQADARSLIERLGPNQQLLASELDKLLIYDPNVTKKSIELLTEPTPQSTIFQLLDAAFAGNKQRTLVLYQEQRAQKVEPGQIIAMLGWQLHILAVVKTAGERTDAEVAQEAKLNPFVVRKSQTIARQVTLSELKQLINDVLKLDISLKNQSIDADDALMHLLMKMSSR